MPDLELLSEEEVQVTCQQNPAVATIRHHSTYPSGRRSDRQMFGLMESDCGWFCSKNVLGQFKFCTGQVEGSLNMAWLPQSATASPVAPRRTSIDRTRCWLNRPKLTRKQRPLVTTRFHHCHDVSSSCSIIHLGENSKNPPLIRHVARPNWAKHVL